VDDDLTANLVVVMVVVWCVLEVLRDLVIRRIEGNRAVAVKIVAQMSKSGK